MDNLSAAYLLDNEYVSETSRFKAVSTLVLSWMVTKIYQEKSWCNNNPTVRLRLPVNTGFAVRLGNNKLELSVSRFLKLFPLVLAAGHLNRRRVIEPLDAALYSPSKLARKKAVFSNLYV